MANDEWLKSLSISIDFIKYNGHYFRGIVAYAFACQTRRNAFFCLRLHCKHMR